MATTWWRPALTTLFLVIVCSALTEARAIGSLLYDFKTSTLLGKPAELGIGRSKLTLVVGVASYCGYAHQYQGLEKLHRELSGKGFAVLELPSDDGEQEPDTSQEIADFRRLKCNVTFPMFARIVTRSGRQQSPIYTFLAASGHLPAWNFSKYLVSRDRKVVASYPSDVTPESPKLRGAITKALASH